MTTCDDKEGNTMKMSALKNQIAQLLKILSNLKELLQNIQKVSIDPFVDLLTHKFNVISTDSTVADFLNVSSKSSLNFESDFMQLEKHDFSSMYLTDILRRCIEKERQDSNEADETAVNDDLIRDIIWPGVMNRLDNYLDQRMKIKVDLVAMVENIGDECVQTIIDDMFKNK